MTSPMPRDASTWQVGKKPPQQHAWKEMTSSDIIFLRGLVDLSFRCQPRGLLLSFSDMFHFWHGNGFTKLAEME